MPALPAIILYIVAVTTAALSSQVTTSTGIESHQPESILTPTPLPRPGDLPPGDPTPPAPELLPIRTLSLNPLTADQARARLDAHLDAHPDSAWAELLYGMSYHVQGRYGPARPHFERSIRLEPRLSATYHFYGYCLYYLGEAELARAAFEMHLHFLPREGNSHFGIGLIDLDEDRIDDAERRFRLAIEYQAGNPRRIKDVAAAHARLADVDVRRGDLDDALAELDTAVALFPDLYGAHLKRYQVLVRLGRDDDADRAYDTYEAALARVRPELSTGGAAPSADGVRP